MMEKRQMITLAKYTRPDIGPMVFDDDDFMVRYLDITLDDLIKNYFKYERKFFRDSGFSRRIYSDEFEKKTGVL